jgi:hypothetical protein
MSENDKQTLELEEGEREVLHNALEILSPDSPDVSEVLEVMTQNVLDATIEPGAVEMEFTLQEIELAISALEVIDPDDFEVQDLAANLEERFRMAHAENDSMSFGM